MVSLDSLKPLNVRAYILLANNGAETIKPAKRYDVLLSLLWKKHPYLSNM